MRLAGEDTGALRHGQASDAGPSTGTIYSRRGSKDAFLGKNNGKPLDSKGAEAYEVVYVKENVSVHPTQFANERISGRLRLIKQGSSLFLTWIPYVEGGNAKETTSTMIPNNGKKTAEKDRNLYTIRAVSLTEMRSIRRHTPPLGWQYIIIVLTNGLAFPPLYFHFGGVREFLGTLKEHALLVRSSEDANVYLVNDIQDPLQKSLTSLDLTEVTMAPQKESSSQETPIHGQDENFEDSSQIYRQNHTRDAAHEFSIQVLEKFSMVTKFARDTTAQLIGSLESLGAEQGRRHHTELERLSSFQQVESSEDVVSELQPQSSSKISDPFDGAESNSEGQASTNVGTFELVDGAQNDTPSLVWGRARPPPLGNEEWATFLDNEGRIIDPNSLKRRIFYGGIEQNLRCEVWKFLLEYYPFSSTAAERASLKAKRRDDYDVLKMQWQSVSNDQAKRFSKFRERKSRVEKDVVRTDRTVIFYAGDDNVNISILRDILITYSFYNFDLGYCQGMSDLLSPILYVMQDESEAFWSFAALMERLGPNFHRDQNGMHSQLLALSKLVQLLDTPLHEYFKQVDCLNYFFCFRWVLIQFKREFEYSDVLRLWEVLWTRHLSEHLHLYICVALLKRHRRKIMDEQMEFDSLLKFINELSGHIELDSTLRDAEALCSFAGERGIACIPSGTPPSFARFDE